MFMNTRRVLSNTSSSTCSSGSTTSAFAPSRMPDSTLINIRNPSSSRKTSFVWPSWRRILCISARTLNSRQCASCGEVHKHTCFFVRVSSASLRFSTEFRINSTITSLAKSSGASSSSSCIGDGGWTDGVRGDRSKRARNGVKSVRSISSSSRACSSRFNLQPR